MNNFKKFCWNWLPRWTGQWFSVAFVFDPVRGGRLLWTNSQNLRWSIFALISLAEPSICKDPDNEMHEPRRVNDSSKSSADPLGYLSRRLALTAERFMVIALTLYCAWSKTLGPHRCLWDHDRHISAPTLVNSIYHSISRVQEPAPLAPSCLWWLHRRKLERIPL